MRIKRVRDLQKFIALSEKCVGPRVLVADIETFPIVAYVWGCFKQNISIDQIKEDWAMMSFACKWLNIPGVYYKDNRDQWDPKDDSVQLTELYAILEHVDMVIAHNGQRFDMPKIRARMAIRKFLPLPPIAVIDTLNANRTAFGLTSQKLAYLTSEHTGFSSHEKTDHKKFPGWKLWLGCMAGILAAWRECESYNIVDVISLEEVYLSTRGWHTATPNFGPYVEHVDGEHVCPNCGGKHVSKKGIRRTQVGLYQRFNCTECGAWSRGRLLTASKQQRSHILMN